MTKAIFGAAFLGAALLFASGCDSMKGPVARTEGLVAAVDLSAIGTSKVSGNATFTQHHDTTHLQVMLQGLSPGPHGIHVHEGAACGADGEAAGGHFNPMGKDHGMAASEDSHMGDLGNITADKFGKASLSIDDPYLILEGPNSIIGRTLVIHAGADDMRTQPSGNSGARIACGAITAASK
jgi:Cu-Zn family superoxide dismutase